MYALSPARERRLVWLLALVQFTLIMDFMVMMPLGPQIMDAFKIGPAAFAMAVSAYSWCSGVSGLFAATFIDRFDRRRLLLAVYTLFALSNLGCALAPSLPLLLAARAFAGITGGWLGANVMAIVADVVPVERRGTASGIIMTGFSIAAIAGVPFGVLVGARFGWSSAFWLLAALCAIIGCTVANVVPPLSEHLRTRAPVPMREAIPALGRLLFLPRHLKAFVLTFLMMLAHMLLIPFIAPMLVANHQVPPGHLSWMYMAGGAATLYTSRAVGRLADRYGHRRIFRIFGVLSVAPALFLTHLPNLPYVALLPFFALFMVISSGRMVPMQAILTTVPAPAVRGAFLSANNAVQALAGGCGAWLGGLFLSTDTAGRLIGYGTNGWLSVALATLALVWVGHVAMQPREGAAEQPAKPQPQLAGEA